MKLKKLVSLSLALLMLLGTIVSLSSCFLEKEDDPAESQPDGNDSQSENIEGEHVLNLTENGTTKFVIVVPNKDKDFTSKMLSALNQLIAAFKSYTGAKIEWKRDFEGWDVEPDENAYEILIGNTNRHHSADAIADLGYGEYAIVADGNKLVINGTSEAAIVSAMEYFATNMIKGNPDLAYNKTDANFVFTTSDNYIKRGNYQIKSIKINDTKIGNMKIVYPDGDMNAKYAASLIKKHILSFSGNNLPIVSDAKAGFEPAILVGATKRSSITAPDGKFLIEVTAKGLEIAVNDMFTYPSVYSTIINKVLLYSNPHIELTTGQKWDGDSLYPENATRDTDIRIMYHNIWGYMITQQMIEEGHSPNPVVSENVSRYAIANAVYDAYDPDILCFQEWGTSNNIIGDHVAAKGYTKVTENQSDKHPIWYKGDIFTLVASGTTKGWSSYYSNWAVFEVKETGKIFAVTNSHFTANSMVAQSDPSKISQLGDDARKVDAQSLLASVEAAKAAGPEGMPIITGGDYNCIATSDAYAVLTGGGLINVRDEAEVSANISCCHGGGKYDESNSTYNLPGVVTSSVEGAIDHIMIFGETKAAVGIQEYGVVGDRMTAVSSDHSPHFIDFSFN